MRFYSESSTSTFFGTANEIIIKIRNSDFQCLKKLKRKTTCSYVIYGIINAYKKLRWSGGNLNLFIDLGYVHFWKLKKKGLMLNDHVLHHILHIIE